MQEKTLLIGTYTTHTDSRGVYRLRIREGVALAPELVLEARDPSYLLRAQDALYWVDEALGESEGRIGCAVRTGDTYAVRMHTGTHGVNPCHLARSPQGTWLAAANYTSGEIALLRQDTDGAWQEAGVFPGRWSGLNPQRQEGPHAHFVAFCAEDTLLACDLGGDCLRRLTCRDGRWYEEEPVLFFPAGSGPRHMVLRGELAYVLCELSCELITISYVRGEVLSRVPMLFEPAAGTAAALRMSPSGELLASHRGADTISVFSLKNPASPALRAVIPCGGKGPRDFWPLADGSIVCACQESGEVTLVRQTPEGYKAVQRIALPAPVCVIEE